MIMIYDWWGEEIRDDTVYVCTFKALEDLKNIGITTKDWASGLVKFVN